MCTDTTDLWGCLELEVILVQSYNETTAIMEAMYNANLLTDELTASVPLAAWLRAPL